MNVYLSQVSRVPSSCQNFKCAHFFDVNLLLQWSTVVRSNDKHTLLIKFGNKSTIPTGVTETEYKPEDRRERI